MPLICPARRPRQALGLQRRLEFAGIDVIVFDGVARPNHLHPLKARDSGQDRELNLLRQRSRDAVGIDGGVVEPFRLPEDLMAVAVAEADDLVLDRRTVAGPLLLIWPEYIGERWTLARMTSWVAGVVRVMPHWICGVVIRSVMTENGSGGSSPGCISTADQSIVVPSSRGGVPVFNRPSVKPGLFERGRKAHRRRLADPARRPVLLAEINQAAQKGSGGDDDGSGRKVPGPRPA